MDSGISGKELDEKKAEALRKLLFEEKPEKQDKQNKFRDFIEKKHKVKYGKY